METFKNIIFWSEIDIDKKLKILSRPSVHQKESIKKAVKTIISDVQSLGDKALYKYTKKFDKIILNKIKVNNENILNAHLKVSKKLKESINNAKNNIKKFHIIQKGTSFNVDTQVGITCEQLVRPIDSVGIYIPGGSAPLISTVLMLAIPAYLAGCKRIVLCSPPIINDAILYAASICHVHEIYQLGGAQAIAALSYGTKTVPKVNKIFGPGNAYVTEAKLQVSNSINGTNIDMLAGPSELVIIADQTANPEFIAADLISQAEHGVDSQVFLISPSKKLINEVYLSVSHQIKNISRTKIVKRSLYNSYFIVTKDIFEAIEISNIYAPEHLIIQTNTPRSIIQYITNAGSIFLGKWSPESVGDYASGTNHVLPTYGHAMSKSGLGTRDFQKYITIQELTPEGLLNISSTVKNLSQAESLDGHNKAVQLRIDYIRSKLNV